MPTGIPNKVQLIEANDPLLVNNFDKFEAFFENFLMLVEAEDDGKQFLWLDPEFEFIRIDHDHEILLFFANHALKKLSDFDDSLLFFV